MGKFVYERREFYMPEVIFVQQSKKYGFFNFLFDVLLVGLTGGIWLIWIFVREMRRR